jgi:membrane protein DedA with SNARE-associated domain
MSLDEVARIVVVFVKENRHLAAPIVFALAFGESLAFLSLVIPATIILVGISGLLGAGGYTVWNLWDVLLAGGIGGALGYSVSYWVGLYFKDRVRTIWPFSSNPELLDRGHQFFEKWGALGVFLGHFFGPVRAVIPVVAGMVAMRQLPFQLANISSAFLWAIGVMAPGMIGAEWLVRWLH